MDIYKDKDGNVVHKCRFRGCPEFTAEIPHEIRNKLGVVKDSDVMTVFSVYAGRLFVWREDGVGADDQFIFHEVTDPEILFHCYMAIANEEE